MTTTNKNNNKKKNLFGKIKRTLGITNGGKTSTQSTVSTTSANGSLALKHVPRSSNVQHAVSTADSSFASGKVTEAPTTLKSPTSPTTTPTRSSKKMSSSDSTKARPGAKKPWLTRTKFFRTLLDQAFETVDQDRSGSVDEKELYSGLLLIHLQLGMYAGPAACKAISRQKCHSVFQKMDVDRSGSLDREEFDNVMCVLFGNVLLRVLFQYACTLMLVPVLAQYVYKGIVWLLAVVTSWLLALDDDVDWANRLHAQTDLIWISFVNWIEDDIPRVVQDGYDAVVGYVDRIPPEVWDTIPITLLSTILSLMIIPWSLLKIDDFFQYLAERKGVKA